jgi:hypothetical protein
MNIVVLENVEIIAPVNTEGESRAFLVRDEIGPLRIRIYLQDPHLEDLIEKVSSLIEERVNLTYRHLDWVDLSKDLAHLPGGLNYLVDIEKA